MPFGQGGQGGAVGGFLAGVRLDAHRDEQRRAQEQHELQKRATQLDLVKARQELAEWKDTAGHRKRMRDLEREQQRAETTIKQVEAQFADPTAKTKLAQEKESLARKRLDNIATEAELRQEATIEIATRANLVENKEQYQALRQDVMEMGVNPNDLGLGEKYRPKRLDKIRENAVNSIEHQQRLREIAHQLDISAANDTHELQVLADIRNTWEAQVQAGQRNPQDLQMLNSYIHKKTVDPVSTDRVIAGILQKVVTLGPDSLTEKDMAALKIEYLLGNEQAGPIVRHYWPDVEAAILGGSPLGEDVLRSGDEGPERDTVDEDIEAGASVDTEDGEVVDRTRDQEGGAIDFGVEPLDARERARRRMRERRGEGVSIEDLPDANPLGRVPRDVEVAILGNERFTAADIAQIARDTRVSEKEVLEELVGHGGSITMPERLMR